MRRQIIAKYYLPIVTIFFVALIFITYPFTWFLRLKGRRKAASDGKPWNILYVIATLELGGTEFQLARLLKALNRNQYKPFLCCTVGSGPLEEQVKELGIPIFILKKKNKFNFTVVFDIVRIIKENKIDVIHSFLFASNFWARLAGILASAKVIIASERSAYKKPQVIIYDRILSHFTDSIICNSEAVKQFQIETEKINPKKLDVVYNGLDVSEFDSRYENSLKKADEYRKKLNIDKKDFVIGNICRITPEKNLELWLETAAKVAAQKKNVKFILVGGANPNIGEEVPYRNKILGMLDSLNLKNNVILTGYSHDVTQELALMNLFFLSSKIEGFPNVVMEAMAAGKPVIATSAGGTKELVNLETGVIIENNNPEIFSGAIIELLEDKEKMEQMGKAGRKRLEEKFSAEKLAQDTVGIYKRFIK